MSIQKKLLCRTPYHDGVVDKVYLLTDKELIGYLGEDPQGRIRSLTNTARDLSDYRINTENLTWAYWTRTAHHSFPSFVRAVGNNGMFYDFISSSGIVGMLPALTLYDDLALYGRGTKNDPYKVN